MGRRRWRAVRVKATMLILNLTQKQLSFKLDISQGRVSQWMRNKKIADPELIHAQMISFLEKEEGTTRERINIGSSREHAALPGTIDARRATPSVTDHQPNTGTSTTTPPTATRTAPNAPDLRTQFSPCTPPLEPVRCSGVWLLEPEPARSRHRSRSRFRRPEELPPSTAAAGAAVPAIGCRP